MFPLNSTEIALNEQVSPELYRGQKDPEANLPDRELYYQLHAKELKNKDSNMLKKAYEMGAQIALREAGLSKTAGDPLEERQRNHALARRILSGIVTGGTGLGAGAGLGGLLGVPGGGVGSGIGMALGGLSGLGAGAYLGAHNPGLGGALGGMGLGGALGGYAGAATGNENLANALALLGAAGGGVGGYYALRD